MSTPIWSPSAEWIERANISAFIRFVSAQFDDGVEDYETLHRFSVTRIDMFWDALWQFLDIAGDRGQDIVLQPDSMSGAKWFPQARLNFAENHLRRRDEGAAIIARTENGARQRISWRELYDAVSRFRQALTACGVKPGDRVFGCLPNVPEAVIALLATTSLGAIWSCCSPDYGEQSLIDRMEPIGPKVFIVADGYRYGGKLFDTRAKFESVISRLSTLDRVVVVSCVGSGNLLSEGGLAVVWNDFLAGYSPGPIEFQRFPFDHPLYVLFSSGTTGKPKAILHRAGGCLLQGMKAIALHCNTSRNDLTFYHTNTGWVVWNHMLSALAWNSPVLLYDGSPTEPRLEAIFDVVASENVNSLRIVPAMIDAYAKAGLQLARTHDLTSLKSIMAGSAPLLPHHYEYVYSNIKNDVYLFSPAGGTDSMGSLATGNPLGSVYPGEIQARGLGMKVEVFDEQGQSIIGRPGELVCTKPFPSIPLAYWGDETNTQLNATYFSMYPGVWRHGDWAEITPRGGVVIYGRADATLNVNGVRMGTAEIYRGLEGINEIKEAVAVAQRFGDGERIILFVQLANGLRIGSALDARIKSQIRTTATARHVPAKVIQVVDIPRSMNGKPSEIAVRETIHGRQVNRLGLSNPSALDLFRNISDLAS